jgi:2-hydroxychromene-2-carboxylate isomerase
MAGIEFWYEFGSTYSYPTAVRIERMAADAGIALHWRPFLLSPIFQALGWNDSPFNIYPRRGAICGAIWSGYVLPTACRSSCRLRAFRKTD